MTPATLLERVEAPDIIQSRPALMIGCLVLSDAFALLLAVGFSVLVKSLFVAGTDFSAYFRLWPFLFVFLIVYALHGLYSGVPLGAPEELRRATLSSGLVFLFGAAATVTLRHASTYLTYTLLLALLTSVVLVPLLRAVTRRRFSQRDWWGYPAILFGAGEPTYRMIRYLQNDPRIGLRPIAIVDDRFDGDSGPDESLGVPVLNGWRLRQTMADHPEAYGVVVMSAAPHRLLSEMIEEYGFSFSSVLVMPDFLNFSMQWSGTKNLGGRWGLEIRGRGLSRPYQIAKRILDLSLCAVLAPAIAVICGAIALLIRLSETGPVFYGHRRIGKSGSEFHAWKFRTMAVDSGRILDEYLAKHPEARHEWEAIRKLKHDPRVTRVGNFLRKTSLDELPQFWNVIRGQMSLVGPRPIVQDEVKLYGDSFALYAQVPGGVTGLWQVSGRNNTTYEERVMLDEYYTRNWSIWLDLCILFQTIEAVLFRRGAC